MSDKIEIYKMAAEMADRVSARRMTANGFFLTLNTALVGILSFFYEKLAEDKRAVLIFMSAVGIVVAFSWFFTIRSYKRLNRAKFTVINRMESQLPYQNFSDEWKELKRETSEDDKLVGGRNWWLKFKDRYTELTNIEGIVPILFGLVYALILLGATLKVIVK
jgi:hypothetical protein